MSISSIWGSFGFCVQSVVKACDCSSSEVNSSSDSGLLQSPPPFCPLPRPTSHPLTSRYNDKHAHQSLTATLEIQDPSKTSKIKTSKAKVREWLLTINPDQQAQYNLS